MSKHKRKPAKAKPISANPLFPAVVALWFGAAFGLGSLAVRPSLLEDLVLKSHLDLIIPAAAPPLGVTSRILLALVLAALGAAIGIALARRLSRPKVEERERKRGARDLAADAPRQRGRDAHPDAPARRPISAHEEFGDEEPFEPAQPSGGLLANRRRALAIIEDEPDFVPHESAPLPGLDPVQPLDLASLSLPADPPVEAQPSYTAPAPAPSLDWAQAAPLTAPAAAAAPLPATMVPVSLDPALEAAPISAEAAHLDGRQVFGMTPQPAPETTPRQIFGIQAEGDHVPQDFVKAAGFQTSVFDRPEPSPLFERPAETVAADPAPVAEPAPVQSAPVQEPEAPAPAFAPAPAADASSAPVEPLPSPSSLGMTDLAARLAESMRRRRERAQSAATPAPAQPAVEAAAPSVPSDHAPVSAELPAMPAAFAPPSTAPDAVPPVPQATETATTLPQATEPAVAAGDALPRFASPTQAEPAPAPVAPLAVPAAMRPLALDAFLEEDAALQDTSLLPPRHITIPTPPQPAPFAAPIAASASATEAPLEETDTATEVSLADVAEDNPYASLLELATPRHAHVRIEESEPAEDAEIEPVVIFPGQTGQVVPIAPAVPQGAEEGGFRRFDAPETAGQGQPVAASAAASLIPADEAAQALRSALSNLQRMSGAA